jgi:hypothetical protein
MPQQQVPKKIEKIIDEVIANSGHPRDSSHFYSVEVPLQVKFNEKLLKRIYGSKDENIIWYLNNNPGFLDKFGLLVIIEVSWNNVFGTLINLGKYLYPVKKRGLMQRLGKSAATLKQKTNGLQNAFKKWTL